MKISKLLPITMALMLGISSVYAEEPEYTYTTAASDSDSAVYTVQLDQYFNVQAPASIAMSTATYSDDYTSITVPEMSGIYNVTSNAANKDIYFYATCLAGSAEVPALYSTAEGQEPWVIFTNTKIDTADNHNPVVSEEQIEAIREGGAGATASPNAIVLKLGITPALVEGSYPTSRSISAQTISDNNVKYTIPNCKAKFTCVIGGTAKDDSFSTLDTNGLYSATLYLSDQPQSL